jgi:hypothetical protein
MLAALALIAAVTAGIVAAPTPATATGTPLEPRPVDRQNLRTICTLLTGTFTADLRSSTCVIADGAIGCETACGYSVTGQRALPPLKEPCDLAGGIWRDHAVGHVACEFKGDAIDVICVVQPETLPWWFRPGVVCTLSWRSDQPMS